ncbi:MAG: hypothetical protein ABI054_06075 [Planctomycetota bacterium]
MSDETFSAIAQTREEAHAATLRAYSHAKAMLDNGEMVLITCGPSVLPVSVQQRRFLHGVVLKQISEGARVDGQRYTIDVWKEHYRTRFVGDGGFRWESTRVPKWDAQAGTYVVPKRATPRRVRISTEELGVRDYAKWTNEIIDHAVLELSVEFHFTNEERELIAKKPKRSDE